MMAMVQPDLCRPGTIGLALQRIGQVIPAVEIAHQDDVPGLRRDTIEVDGFYIVLGGVTAKKGGPRFREFGHHLWIFHCLFTFSVEPRGNRAVQPL